MVADASGRLCCSRAMSVLAAMGIRTGIKFACVAEMKTRGQKFKRSHYYTANHIVLELRRWIYHLPSTILLSFSHYYEVDESDLAHGLPYLVLSQPRADLDRKVNLCLSRSASRENRP